MINSAYIHIPFCHKLCHYCDFVKYFYNEQMADDYLQALDKEMATTVQGKYPKMRTVYIGGGTPTSLTAKQLDDLLTIIHKHLDLSSCEEFTIEANPGNFDEEKMIVLKKHAINRISLGVQVFDNHMLEELGRLHKVTDVYNTIADLKATGFNNISLDLIYSLPKQTVNQFRETLQEALSFQLPHYSTYSLQIEPKTIFYNRYQKGQLHRPSHEDEAEMFEVLKQGMKSHGYVHYEISNFAKEGFESKHNLTYWSNDYYYGFGSGAAGYLPGKRTINLKAIPAYIKEANKTGKAILEVEQITKKEMIEEEFFLGLRKKLGVNKKRFQEKFGYDYRYIYDKEVDELIEKGWLMETDTHLSLTDDGLNFGNEVFAQFLLEDEMI